MTISLQRFAQGDGNYITKHNSNLDLIETAVAGLEAAAGSGGVASIGAAFAALFGETASLIWAASYGATGSGTYLTVTSGHCWRPGLGTVVKKTTSTIVPFVGITAATWYITADSTGTPIRTSSPTEAMYSVVWTGTAFGTITRLLPYSWVGAVAPATKTVDFTLADTESNLICNKGSTLTVTLPSAASWIGREFTIKTIAAFTVVSASSNVVPADTATPGTAILSATAGKWAKLVSDGTNWIVMQQG